MPASFPAETTCIHRDSFDAQQNPTMLETERVVDTHRDRIVALEPFNRFVLTDLLTKSRITRPDTPLTYKGRKHLPGSYSATASAQTMLNRMFDSIGLVRGSEFSATSIFLWRVSGTYHHQGIAEACSVSGIANPKRLKGKLFRGMQKLHEPVVVEEATRGGFDLD